MNLSPEITRHPLGTLKPYPGNPRTHSQKQIRQIADSIRIFGWTNPILVDEAGMVMAGHGRLAAAKRLGLEEAPVLCITHMTVAQKKAYMLADNRLAELAGWDQDLLALEFKGLMDLDLDFDFEVTGFETAEIDLMVQPVAPIDDPADRPAAIVKDQGPVSVPGGLWLLGDHRLLCGNALEGPDYQTLMAGAKAQAVFTDPPYNVHIDGHVCGLGAVRHREFVMASGEMSPEAFTTFLKTVFGHLVPVSTEGSLHYICMDWRHMPEILAAGNATYTSLQALCVWNKSNAGMGSFYRSKHELVFVFKNGKGPHINTIQLGRHGRYRTNVWDYAGVNSFGESRGDLALHPTVKPVRMIADALLDCTRRGQIVLDPFIGSGSTILAAERTGRIAYGMEIDPAYVDAAILRWQAFTGGDAIHTVTGLTFTETKTRAAEEGAGAALTPAAVDGSSPSDISPRSGTSPTRQGSVLAHPLIQENAHHG